MTENHEEEHKPSLSGKFAHMRKSALKLAFWAAAAYVAVDFVIHFGSFLDSYGQFRETASRGGQALHSASASYARHKPHFDSLLSTPFSMPIPSRSYRAALDTLDAIDARFHQGVLHYSQASVRLDSAGSALDPISSLVIKLYCKPAVSSSLDSMKAFPSKLQGLRQKLEIASKARQAIELMGRHAARPDAPRMAQGPVYQKKFPQKK